MNDLSKKSAELLRIVYTKSELAYMKITDYYAMDDFESLTPEIWAVFFPKTLALFEGSKISFVCHPGRITFYFAAPYEKFPGEFSTFATVTISNFPSNCGTVIFNNMKIMLQYENKEGLNYNLLLEELELLVYSFRFTCVVYNSTDQERYEEMNKVFAKRDYANVFEFINARSSNTNYFWFKNLRLDE